METELRPEHKAVTEAFDALIALSKNLLALAEITTEDKALRQMFTDLASSSIDANQKMVTAVKGLALYYATK